MNPLTTDDMYMIDLRIYGNAERTWRNAHVQMQPFIARYPVPVWGSWHRTTMQFVGGEFERARIHKKGHGWKAGHLS